MGSSCTAAASRPRWTAAVDAEGHPALLPVIPSVVAVTVIGTPPSVTTHAAVVRPSIAATGKPPREAARRTCCSLAM